MRLFSQLKVTGENAERKNAENKIRNITKIRLVTIYCFQFDTVLDR